MKKNNHVFPTKILTICALALLFVTSCRHSDYKSVSVPITDSSKLMTHLDSLPPVKFPYGEDGQNQKASPVLNLSEFKSKKLFNLPLTLIPTKIGGGILDDSRVDSTFNLTDRNFKANWELIGRTPKFFVIEVEGVVLATLTYDLKVIDAINTETHDPANNNNFNADRYSTINKDLTIALHNKWYMAEEEGSGETEKNDEDWLISKDGHFIKKEP